MNSKNMSNIPLRLCWLLSSCFPDICRWCVDNSRGGHHVISGRVTFSLIGCQGVCREGPGASTAAGKCQGLVRRQTGLEISAAPFITVTVSLPVTRFSGPYHPFWVISGCRGPKSPKSPGALSLPLIHFQGSNKLTKHFFTHTLSTKWPQSPVLKSSTQ